MDYLWTPWRYNYIATKERKPGCPFCHLLNEKNDQASLIVYRGKKAFVMLNMFPYNCGHVMILPYVHEAALTALDDETGLEFLQLTRRCVDILTTEYEPQGFNIGVNLGSCAGAGIAEHVHQHIVPRWVGDANFMSVLGETRVLPEELGATYNRLRKHFS